MKAPRMEEVRRAVRNPDCICIYFFRDAWQVTARPKIVETHLGGREFTMAEMTSADWFRILNEALACLDEERDVRGRARQSVTLAQEPRSGSQHRVMEVSPHLTIQAPMKLDEKPRKNLKSMFAQLRPVYDWVEAAGHA